MILRNPQALYILRNLEKFENSIKIHFFIREIAANFKDCIKMSRKIASVIKFWAFIASTLMVCCFGGRNNAQL